jgi:hypothetical protein
MFARLWIALKKWGASEGKPFLGIQVLGIPVVALVYLILRGQLGNGTKWNFLLPEVPPNWDWIVACLILIVYAVDFIFDAVMWDGLGTKLHAWHLILAVGWILFGSFVLLMLVVVLPLLGFGTSDKKALLDLLWSLRIPILGGLMFGYFKWRGGLIFALLGPILIAFVFAAAVFGGLPTMDIYLFWLQGFFIFLLNILLLQYFEKDKDAVSETPNLWVLVSTQWLKFLLAMLVLLISTSWVVMNYSDKYIDGKQFGPILLLFFYGLMFLFPKAFKFARFYRVLIDATLFIWLI